MCCVNLLKTLILFIKAFKTFAVCVNLLCNRKKKENNNNNLLSGIIRDYNKLL